MVLAPKADATVWRLSVPGGRARPAGAAVRAAQGTVHVHPRSHPRRSRAGTWTRNDGERAQGGGLPREGTSLASRELFGLAGCGLRDPPTWPPALCRACRDRTLLFREHRGAPRYFALHVSTLDGLGAHGHGGSGQQPVMWLTNVGCLRSPTAPHWTRSTLAVHPPAGAAPADGQRPKPATTWGIIPAAVAATATHPHHGGGVERRLLRRGGQTARRPHHPHPPTQLLRPGGEHRACFTLSL